MRRAATIVVVVVLGLVAVWLVAREPEPNSGGVDSTSADADTDGTSEPRDRPTLPTLAPDTLAGTVLSTDGRPLPNAQVTVTAYSLDDPGASAVAAAPRLVSTDDQGQWRFGGVASGRYEVSATAAGHLPAAVRPVVVDGRRGQVELELRLEPGGYVLSGTVTDAFGGTVDGATVTVGFGRAFGGTTPVSVMTHTDETGAYALQLAPGRYSVEVDHPSYAAGDSPLRLNEHAQTLDFRLVPGASVEGVVRRVTDGEPVAGAQVVYGEAGSLMRQAGFRPRAGGSHHTLTDADGRFRFSGLSSGVLVLSAFGDRYATPESTDVVLAIAEDVDGVELWVGDAARVTGVVVWSDTGDPVMGATVKLVRGSPTIVVLADSPTGEDGRFVVAGVFAGSYEATGHGARIGEAIPTAATVGDDDVVGLRIEVKHGTTLRGRVEPPMVAELNAVLAGQSVGLWSSNKRTFAQATSAPDGSFEFTGLPDGTIDINAEAEDGRRGAASVQIPAVGELVLELAIASAVSGTVVDTAEVAVGGVRVCARPNSDTRDAMPAGARASGCSYTLDDGTFDLRGLVAGGYAVKAYAAGGFAELPTADGRDVDVDVPADAPMPSVTLVVEPHDGRIDGTVVGPDGEPLDDALVRIAYQEPDRTWSDGSLRKGARTTPAPAMAVDADGRFSADGLARGSYFVTAQARGGALRAEVTTETDATLVIETVGVGSIVGSVSSTGPAPKQFTVRVAGPTPIKRTFSWGTGQFEIANLTPGEYTVVAEASQLVGSEPVTVPADGEGSVDIELEAQSRVTGRAVDHAGAPLAGVRVESKPQAGTADRLRSWSVRAQSTGEDGKFELDDVTPGPGKLSLQGPGRLTKNLATASEEYSVEAGQSVDVGDVVLTSMADIFNEMYADHSDDLGLRFFAGEDPPTEEDLAALDADPSLMRAQVSNEAAKLWIAEVDAGGVGESAGFEVGDQVLAIGRSTVSGTAFLQVTSLSRAWRSKGRPVVWKIERDESPMDIEVLVPE